MKSKLEQQEILVSRLKGVKLNGVSEKFAITPEEALSALMRKTSNKRRNKAKKKKGKWSPVLPGSFESSSR
ncbi:hypothetical protein QN400_10685 [Pseudomonas sp. RTC3]|uniref:hypothetical protein n=1 Tax=unclassified Pseudomonas TaxID=196821 RepID=UPI002AB56BE8|nr:MULTISPECIES: hypothetical protein [unclassified Pseudomonas]MEB0062493.1 hypothetical protein [Pseudomonas sp. RTC3]MDY7565824.1 hypothetical protein [Pseudomonas sp. 5C2]MEB0027563.1 hypothetical protein [Pseudomonas sp. MH9.2]MEB0240498.1 hypothetical protein [Pseudomonas sp. 5C2]WPX70377.1 hypothetical protein RHM55_07350 [Pseudomonas sp. MH9.2]